MIKPKVLFLCSGNSCRTQMAEALLRENAGDHFEIVSAGSEATPIDPEAIEAMREVGIDISGQQSKSVDRFLRERFTYVITLCDRKREPSCPIFPGAFWRLQWDLLDPAVAHSTEERRKMIRKVRDDLRQKVLEFVSKNS